MARKRTISMRELSRKDAEARSKVETEAQVIGAVQRAGFETQYPNKRQSNRVIAKTVDREIMIVVWPVVDAGMVELTLKHQDREVDEIWIVGASLTPDVYSRREYQRYASNTKIMNIAEFEAALARLQPSARSRPPAKGRETTVRTRVGKALLVNADELQTAVTTTLLLLENRLEVLNSERPNSSRSIARRDAEITALTEMKGQLEKVRALPDDLKRGKVKENEANRSIKSFSDAVREYWNANSEAICGKAVNIALFTSTVLVCKLAGASGDFTIAVSAAMAGGRTVMDGLKGIMRKVFKS